MRAFLKSSLDTFDTQSTPSKAPQADNHASEEVDYSAKAPNKTKFSDYLRIFTYSTTLDRIFLGIAVVGEIGYDPLESYLARAMISQGDFPHATISKSLSSSTSSHSQILEQSLRC